MKKVMSSMTPQEFVERTAALGLKYIVLADKLHRAHPTISQYSTGAKRIPMEVAERMQELITERAQYFNRLGSLEITPDDVGAMIAQTNLLKQASPPAHENKYRLCRRLRPDTRLYPSYRIRHGRILVYAHALRAWRDEVERRLRTGLSSESITKMHKLELADLKVLFDSVPRRLPYETMVTRSEWQVIGRALRWHYAQDPVGNAPAYAFYQHWRKHKEVGYPYRRAIVVPQQGATP